MADPTAGANPYAAGLGIIGTYFQVQGMREAGREARIRGEMQKAAFQFEAFEADRRAGASIAISQRQALEETRQANLVASRALAVAAASGAGVSDPTMVRVIANARGEGAVRAATALYEGSAHARQLRTEAAMGRLSGTEAELSGRSTQAAYGIQSAGAVAREGLSLYSKYGLNGPKGDTSLISSSGGWQDTGSGTLPDTTT